MTSEARAIALDDERAAARMVGQTLCHQIRNTLTITAMTADVAAISGEREKALEGLDRVRDAAMRLEPAVVLYHRWLAGEAVPPAGGGGGRPPGCDLARAAGAALDLCAHALSRAGIVLERDLAPAPVALGAEDALSLALTLVAGASLLVAAGGEQRLTLRAATAARGGPATLSLEVRGASPALVDASPRALERSLAAAARADPRDPGRLLPALAGARGAATAAGGTLALDPGDAPGAFAVRLTLPPA